MHTEHPEAGTILVVEDETDLADLYTEYLQNIHTVRTAYSGDEAIDMLAADIDVVLLDRRMPVTPGNEVLAAIARADYECRVAMVTAVNPDFDIIDLGVDDYLVKPVSKRSMLEVVDRLLTISEYRERRQEYTTKKLKRNVLRVEKPASELKRSDHYRSLQSELETLERELDDLSASLPEDDLLRHR